LSGWSLVLYNGSNGLVYNTTALVGTIPNQAGFYGTVVVNYPTNGIQNGAPDGIALVNGATVVQFLSYEGTLVANNGPAIGMTSTDIGVSESSSTVAGTSLQLAGTGTSDTDFTWQPSQPETFGAPNTGQTFTGTPQALPPTSVFINEIHYDNVGVDEGEAVEVAGPAGTDLTGWSLVFYNGSNGLVYATDTLAGTIPNQAGFYGTVVVNRAGIQNGAPDGIALVNGATVVQFLSYEGSLTANDGPATGLTSTDIGVSEGSATRVGTSLQLAGTGTNDTDFTWQPSQAETFGAPNTGQTFTGTPPPSTGSDTLVINEIDYDQPGTDDAEYVEVYNKSSETVNLDTWRLDFGNGGGGAVYRSFPLPNVDLAAGGYFVVCGNAATVQNCDLVVPPATNLIQNGSPDAVALFAGTDLVDTVSYEGDTVAPYAEGSGIGLEDPSNGTFHGISRLPNGADTDVNNVDLSTRCSTPGADNTSDSTDCIPPPPECVPVPVLISVVQGNGASTPCEGVTVTVEGVVVGDYEGSSPNLRGFYVEEEDADHDGDPATSEGIFVFNFDNNEVSLGDQVRVTGTATEFQGQTQIGFPDDITEIATGQGGLVTPAPAGLPVVSADFYERFEGMSVTYAQTLFVTEHFQLGRFGQVVVSSGDRLYQPTNVVAPGAPANAVQATNDLNRVIVDDALNNQNPDPIIYGRDGNELTASNTLRGRDTLTGATGVMTYT